MSTILDLEVLEQLGRLSRELEAATSGLNATLAREEARINDTGCTVTAHVDLSEGWQLLWTRTREKDSWGFYARSERDFQRLSNAPRAVRLEALGKLNALADALCMQTASVRDSAQHLVGGK